jgi:hypothetical protein
MHPLPRLRFTPMFQLKGCKKLLSKPTPALKARIGVDLAPLGHR